MGKVWVITGPPGVGKSSVVSKVVLRMKSAGIMVGGCSSVEKRAKGVRVGFEVRDLTDGMVGELASVSGKLGPRVGKYRVNLSDLSRIGAAGLRKAAVVSELIVVDEVGPMELVSPEFRRAVEACVSSPKPILAVLHERLDDDLLNLLRKKAEKSFELTTENRDSVVEELTDTLLSAVGGPQAS
ncbi:MAG: NTPase [Thaumarchaeota archaeon]|nr:NTPase [Nitrososphaerota archaeon]